MKLMKDIKFKPHKWLQRILKMINTYKNILKKEM